MVVCGCSTVHSADRLTVHGPLNEVRLPNDLVGVPLIPEVCNLLLGVIMQMIVAVTIVDISVKRWRGPCLYLATRHDLNIKLVPGSISFAGTSPVGEKSTDSGIVIRHLHGGSELAVSKGFVSLEFARVVRPSCADLANTNSDGTY